GMVAADGQLIRARPFDVQAPGDGQLAVGEGDGLAGQTGGEVDDIAALGGGDLAAQRAVARGTGVEGVGDGQRAGHPAVLEGLQVRAKGTVALANGRRRTPLPGRCAGGARLEGVEQGAEPHGNLLYECGLLYNGDGDLSGAQTERRGGAGPVGGACLAVRTPPAAFM